MMRRHPCIATVFAAVVLACAACSSALAQWAPNGAGVNYLLGHQGYDGIYGYHEAPYATGRIPTPPYFALHPPVYYSYAVPRPYGYSPYAYPGIVMTPEVVKPPKAEEIPNPHAKAPKQQSAKEGDDFSASGGIAMIENPYAGHADRQAGIQLARLRQQQ